MAAVGKDVENDFSRAQDSQYKAAVVSMCRIRIPWTHVLMSFGRLIVFVWVLTGAQNQNSKSVEAPSSSSSGIKILERREERYDSRVTGEKREEKSDTIRT